MAGIRRVQERLGQDRVSVLMTTTEASLGRAAEIIGTYAGLRLRGVFLRPISPYGFALRGRGGANYDVDRWLEFYAAGLDQIVELNRQGVPMVEIYASIIAKKMLTNTELVVVDPCRDSGCREYVDRPGKLALVIGGVAHTSGECGLRRFKCSC